MKKTGFVIGSIEIILGLLSLLSVSIIKELIPKLARMCFMFNTGGFSESDYILNTAFANKASIVLCAIGIITICYSCFLKKE